MTSSLSGAAAAAPSEQNAAAAAAEGGARRLVQRMHPGDNVATALVDLEPGTVVRVEGGAGGAERIEVTVAAAIRFGHKVALREVAAGEPVLKYGEAIGLAITPIAPGDHVHVHNVDSQRGRGDLKK